MRRWRLLACVWFVSLGLFADRVGYDSGGTTLTLEGRIITKTDEEVVIQTDLGLQFPIPMSTVKEVKEEPHPAIECYELYEKAQALG